MRSSPHSSLWVAALPTPHSLSQLSPLLNPCRNMGDRSNAASRNVYYDFTSAESSKVVSDTTCASLLASAGDEGGLSRHHSGLDASKYSYPSPSTITDSCGPAVRPGHPRRRQPFAVQPSHLSSHYDHAPGAAPTSPRLFREVCARHCVVFDVQ